MAEPQAQPEVAEPDTDRADPLARVKIFIGIQIFFLLVSIITGGFHFRAWSMLDSALLILSLGVSGLVVVLESPRAQRAAFRVAIALYLLAVVDMGINVVVSGIVGWQAIPG